MRSMRLVARGLGIRKVHHLIHRHAQARRFKKIGVSIQSNTFRRPRRLAAAPPKGSLMRRLSGDAHIQRDVIRDLVLAWPLLMPYSLRLTVNLARITSRSP